jgi:ribulose-phosphate 3-epimerase
MDGRFVPQLTYGPVVVEAVRRAAKVPIETHLMIEEPEASIETYAKLGLLGRVAPAERTELEKRVAAYRAI